MDDAVAAAYAASPVWLQHLFVSAYGVRLRFLRDGRRQRRYLAELRRTQWLSAAELRALQLHRLTAPVRPPPQTVGLPPGRRLPHAPFTEPAQLRQLPARSTSA